MKKSISNEEILDIVYDLADARGQRIDEFVALLKADYADDGAPEATYDADALPPEVVSELTNAKALKRELREAQRKSDEEAQLRAEIAAFRELFPDVPAEEIPEAVWAEIAEGNGMDLKHAYALYVLTGKQSGGHADEVNQETASRSAPLVGDGCTEPSFSPEQVERMSARDVAKNYKNVIRSFKNWR